MNIVRLALHRPYTFLVLGITILLLGVSAILRTPTDIFPNINIPVVTVVWYYDGLNNNETEKRITTYSEFSISFFVNDIRTIESQTIPGLVVEKNLFPAGRECRSGHEPGGLGDKLDPRLPAARRPAADHYAIQRLDRTGLAIGAELRPALGIRNFTITASIASASSSRRSPARCCRRPMAGASVR